MLLVKWVHWFFENLNFKCFMIMEIAADSILISMRQEKRWHESSTYFWRALETRYQNLTSLTACRNWLIIRQDVAYGSSIFLGWPKFSFFHLFSESHKNWIMIYLILYVITNKANHSLYSLIVCHISINFWNIQKSNYKFSKFEVIFEIVKPHRNLEKLIFFHTNINFYWSLYSIVLEKLKKKSKFPI